MSFAFPSSGRGLGENKPIIRNELRTHFNNIKLKTLGIVKDCTQCLTAIGDVDCKYTYCYLCSARIPVRKGEKCDDKQNDSHFTSNSSSYPQCEHIIPCETEAVAMNPYLRMIMITNVTQALIKKEYPSYQQVLDDTRVNKLLKEYNKKNKKDKKKFFILNIMLRLNYSWAHAYCNIKKGNKNFINYNGANFFIDDGVINTYLDKIFNDTANWSDRVANELNMFFTKDQYLYDNQLDQKKDARKSIKKRLNGILNILNHSDYEQYRNSNPSTIGGNKNSKLLFKKKGGGELGNLIIILNNIIKSPEIINLINLIDNTSTEDMAESLVEPMSHNKKVDQQIATQSIVTQPIVTQPIVTQPIVTQPIISTTGGAIKCKKEHINIKKLKKLIKNLEEKIKNLKLKKGGHQKKKTKKAKDFIEEDSEEDSEEVREVVRKDRKTYREEDTINKQYKILINNINSQNFDYINEIKILNYLFDEESIPYIEYYDALKWITDPEVTNNTFTDPNFLNRTCDLFLMLNIVFNILSNNLIDDKEEEEKIKAKEDKLNIKEEEKKLELEKDEEEEKLELEKDEEEEKLKLEKKEKNLELELENEEKEIKKILYEQLKRESETRDSKRSRI
jgi:hypothetical protein